MKRFARIVLAVAAATAALPPGPARAATVDVSIKTGNGNEFNPSTLVVHVGDTVQWTNDDRTLIQTGQTDHTVTADDGSFDSKRLKQGQSFEWQFTKAGTFSYHCTIHGWTATVVVDGAGPTRTATPTPTPIATHTTRPKPSKSARPSATSTGSHPPSPGSSIDASGVGGNASSSTGTILSIAIVSIVALILLGYFVYARFLRQD